MATRYGRNKLGIGTERKKIGAPDRCRFSTRASQTLKSRTSRMGIDWFSGSAGTLGDLMEII